jgi:transcription-repair coupling factor (superfamily II helicase)
MEWYRRIEEDKGFTGVLARVRKSERSIRVAGLGDGAKALAVAALAHSVGKRVAFVSLAGRDLEQLEADVRFFFTAFAGGSAGEDDVLVLPPVEADPYSGTSPHAEILERRALALWKLAQGGGRIVLMTAGSLLPRVVGSSLIRQSGVTLRTGEEIPLDYLIDHLSSVGYVRSDPVGSPGEFSSRGGILDFFSPSPGDHPFRIEFFGDAIDSIRAFDPESQRSIAQLSEATIAPMRDERGRAEDFRNWARAAREHWSDERYDRALRDRLLPADDGQPFPGWEHLMPLIHPLESSVFDYLGDSLLIVDEPGEIEKRVRTTYETLYRDYDRAEAADELALRPDRLFLTADEVRKRIGHMQRVELRLLGGAALSVEEDLSLEKVGSTDPLFLFPPETHPVETSIRSRPVRRWHGRLKDLASELNREDSESIQTVFLLPASGAIDRLNEVLHEYGVSQVTIGTSQDTRSRVLLSLGDVSVGFALPDAGLVVYTERDVFDEPTTVEQPRARPSFRKSAFLSDFRDLKIGDYVVHIDHGIGRFQGLIQLAREGPLTPAETYAKLTGAATTNGADGKREFMLLVYADSARLYVPVERPDLVQKYSGGEEHSPALDRLGGIGWQKTKARAKRAMRDMAEELLRLYAERKLVPGYAFSGDSPWQREFEDAFPYELTTDQGAAIVDMKRDMEEPRPMDRLLCGDVGYGKTEVAMRAAFKAIMDGRQVALLAPTTVLAYQHHQTFRSRFAAFPVSIDLLSRFRSPKEQKEVVAAIAEGKVDIVIGTHRILSRDLQFKDLGLLVVDEEQRFGVAHKERLKQLKKRVDVLTLSATPIPRTLNMSLMGLRDMSVIETPPRDRLAIQTNVVAFSEHVIRSAIELELQRQGQVFFVHNRVESIFAIADLIKRIVPEARIVVAHGQMGEKEMEQAMLDFIAYKYDVLVATTIIENGIDIPRANTMIINRADNYGLAQLYQLRGRVGRSNRRAYSYLLIPTDQELTPIARRRLAAIREFSDLGAGFRIAALDLELRGAGNLLGGQQSGHIDAIGFDLYCQMLERTVAELRGEDIVEEVSTQLNLGIETRIPDEYISDMGQRLRTYKRIASARSDEELDRIREEIADRYGRIPESVDNLFAFARVRREAVRLGIVSIDRSGEVLAIKLDERHKIAPERLVKLLEKVGGAGVSAGGAIRLRISSDGDVLDDERVIRATQVLLNELTL